MAKKMYKLSEYQLNKENPFLHQAVEQINNHIVKKYRTATKTDQSAILQAIDPKTQIPVGHTQFVRQIELDEDKFAKFYLSGFSSFFDLKPQAYKVFGYILNQLVPNKDEFVFILDECIEFTKYKTKSSVFIGLGELVEKGVIARGKTEFLYFVNPMVVFNGDRVTFAKTYVKKKNPSIPKNQGSLNFDNPEEPYVLPEVNPVDAF
jgi:intergrase/recombinase